MKKALVGILASCLAAASPALAQPENPPPGERQPMTPEEARRVLTRGLEDARREAEMMEDALRRLDAGAAPGEVLREAMSRVHQQRAARRNEFTERARERRAFADGPGDDTRNDGARPRPPAHKPDPEEVRRHLRERLPEVADELERIRGGEPAFADGLLRSISPRLMDAVRRGEFDAEARDARLNEVRARFRALLAVREYRAAGTRGDADDRSRAEDRVRTALREAFDARAAVEQNEIESLEARVNDLRERTERRGGSRDELIERMIDGLRKGEFPRALFEDGPPTGRPPKHRPDQPPPPR